MCKVNIELQVCWQSYKLTGAGTLKYQLILTIAITMVLKLLKMHDLQQ